MGGMGEEKLYFPLWKSAKHQKATLGCSVSTKFLSLIAVCKSRSESATVSKVVTVSERSLVILFVPQTHALKNSISHGLIKADCMSDLHLKVSLTSVFTAMLQSCNISHNKKYTFVHFLFQMSLVIFYKCCQPSK